MNPTMLTRPLTSTRYHRAQRQMSAYVVLLSNTLQRTPGQLLLEPTMPGADWLFETHWDEAETRWLQAQEAAIGWASRS